MKLKDLKDMGGLAKNQLEKPSLNPLLKQFFSPAEEVGTLLKVQASLAASNIANSIISSVLALPRVAASRFLLVNNFYIYNDTGSEAMKLPIPPESYKITQNQKNTKIPSLKYGEIQVSSIPDRRKLSFECTLPDEAEFHYTYLQYRVSKWKVIDFFRKIQESGAAYNIAITHTDVGTSTDFKALVSEFSYRTEGTCVKMSVTFEEFLDINKVVQ